MAVAGARRRDKSKREDPDSGVARGIVPVQVAGSEQRGAGDEPVEAEQYVGSRAEQHPPAGGESVKEKTSLHDYLEKNSFIVDKGIASLIEEVITSSDHKHKVFLVRGPAGVGKTQLTKLVADYLGANYIYYQCTYGTDEESLLYKYIPSETTKSGIKVTFGAIPRALLASQNNKVVLVIDEFDKTRPSADALLLDVLQNHRVSLYLDEKENIIYGNPQNLIVFLISNDMREFSEPLIRRAISITLELLPPKKVYQLLSKTFSKEIAMLLAQIYDDTVKAGLRKPATLQELDQLGRVIEKNPNMSLNELLRMFVIKYDDDWRKYVSYILTRRPYTKLKQANQHVIDVSKFYEPAEEEEKVEVKEEKKEESRAEVGSLLSKLRRIVVKFDEKLAKPASLEGGGEKVEVAFRAPDVDLETYKIITKTLKPEPTKDPARFGKFEYVLDNEINAIISREPLTVSEARKLADALREVEASYEAAFIGTFNDIMDLMDETDGAKYYSKDLIYVVSEYDKENEERVVFERLSDVSWRVKGYYKKKDKKPVILGKMSYSFLDKSKQLERLLKVLMKPRESVALLQVLSSIKDGETYETDHINPDEVATLLVNLRRSDVKVRVTLDRAQYSNIKLVKTSDGLSVNIGYKLRDKLIEKLGKNIIDKVFDINDPMVDRIIEVLRNVG